jgi:glycosyltransferase involved in cell wall biosynthesis
VVTTGRATRSKGIDFLIECANELINNQGREDVHFLFCGDGPDAGAFKGLVAAYALEAFFTFAGKRSDVRTILPSCDIAFHASTAEVGYSLSILEYMSAGLATIVPDLPSTSETITHLENGLLYRYGDRASACAAISNCFSVELRRRIASNAIDTVNQRYRLETTNAELRRILENQYC